MELAEKEAELDSNWPVFSVVALFQWDSVIASRHLLPSVPRFLLMHTVAVVGDVVVDDDAVVVVVVMEAVSHTLCEIHLRWMTQMLRSLSS